MSKHIYTLSIGPVQDFIAAARRTRDLWFGSFLLSEISKASAKEIADNGGLLIFPALKKGDKDLNPGQNNTAFNAANIILAELPEGIVPGELDKKVQNAAKIRWLQFADEVKGMARDIINEKIWDDQVNDVIELYSAWVPFNGDYPSARKRVMHLLAGRKSVRDFIQPDNLGLSIDKSSLDGARESVFTKDKDLPKTLSLKMRLTKGEKLCAVGLTKRLGGGKNPFPSLVRVALDPWIRGVLKSGEKQKTILKEIGILCSGERPYASETRDRLYQEFPYDGQVLFPSRLKQLKDELNEIGDENLKKDLETIKTKADLLQRKENKGGYGHGDPDPYLALLVADGDRIGKTISGITSPDGHREFSSSLSIFASKAREIVETKHQGCLVYSGGDDVFAFLPVDTCIETARDLHDCFGDLLKQYPDETGCSPTLSVGIAICHIRDPLEDLRTYAKIAEQSAKNPDRNGLAIHLHTRSGGSPLKVREQWLPKGEDGLDKRLSKWVEMHTENLFPDKAAYELRELAKIYEGWDKSSELPLQKDVERVLMRKRAGKGTDKIKGPDMEYLLRWATTWETLNNLAGELILARRITENKRQADKKNKSGPVE